MATADFSLKVFLNTYLGILSKYEMKFTRRSSFLIVAKDEIRAMAM